MALFADCPDHLEWKSGVRVDGAAMSLYNIIAVAFAGIMTGVFNWMLSTAGYIKPFAAESPAEAPSCLAVNGLTAASQSPSPSLPPVLWVITFGLVGLETFTGIILAIILRFSTWRRTSAGSRKRSRREDRQAPRKHKCTVFEDVTPWSQNALDITHPNCCNCSCPCSISAHSPLAAVSSSSPL